MQKFDPPVWQIAGLQFGVVFLLTLSLLALGVTPIGLSLLLGASAGWIASLVYGVFFITTYRKRSPHNILRRAYQAQIAKVLVVAVLFVLVLGLFKDLHALYFFAAFFIQQWVPLFVSLAAKR